MKITAVTARFLLGLIFLVFGLNGFLHLIPMPPPSGAAGQFMGALFVSNYLVVVFLLQIIPAVLLLINRYVPLALTLLAPIIVNILLFHILMVPSGLLLAIVVTSLWIMVFLSVRSRALATARPSSGPAIDDRGGMYAQESHHHWKHTGRS
jgi:putative oxidoreductase